MTNKAQNTEVKEVRTDNGMLTLESTFNSCVDLFFSIGAMRGKSKQTLISKFANAFKENPLAAIRIMFWVRDVRGGAGERQIFRDIIEYLANSLTKCFKHPTEAFCGVLATRILFPCHSRPPIHRTMGDNSNLSLYLYPQAEEYIHPLTWCSRDYLSSK